MGIGLEHRWVRPFVDLLRQGMSVEKIALTIALGVMLGVTPVLGSTILLCTGAAVFFRLNLAAIQLVNGIVYPLQLILLIPFYRMGAWLFGTDSSALTLDGVMALSQAGLGTAVETLWVVTLHALVAWLGLGAVVSLALYGVLVPVVRRIWFRERQIEA